MMKGECQKKYGIVVQNPILLKRAHTSYNSSNDHRTSSSRDSSQGVAYPFTQVSMRPPVLAFFITTAITTKQEM